ncbi:Ankyrin repeat domain-containing protein 17 [Madurella mycetomatis]|uniref:Ankyrin repeat domain-containing protein 17 n=1 Tax=Madurella mycetomatis TaxID=100816 RepID=A0A175VT69_9PEZI|nr:Ankyrin repeat domain-containing protein 17 [Madurella mycetomatis]
MQTETYSSHIIQDLQPYHCTYEGCSDPNRLYGSYQEWIDHESQHTRVWHCHRHAREFETQLEYTQHLRQDHSDTAPKRFSPELVSAAIGPSLRVHRDCPLCPTVFTEVSEMQRHLRYHLERLALFSLPSQNVDWDDGATGKSSDSHQIIQGRGRQASLERDFDDDSNLSSSLSIDSGPGIEENKQVLLETLRQYAPPKPDELAAVSRWIEMLAIEPGDLDGNAVLGSGSRYTGGASQQLARKQVSQLHGKLSLYVSRMRKRNGDIDLVLDKPRALATDRHIYCPVQGCAYSEGQPMASKCNIINIETLIHHLSDSHAETEDIYRSQDKHSSVLLWSAGEGHDAMVKLLLDRGANIDLRYHGQQEEAKTQWSSYFWIRGRNIESRDVNYHRSPLSWAAGEGYDTVVNLLLDRGANIEAQDITGQSPLSQAAGRGRERMVNLLLDRGANIESQDNLDYSPILYAIERGHEVVVKLLLDRGAHIESGYILDRSLLSFAAQEGHATMVKLLLDREANIESQDDLGRSPLSLAAQNGHETVVKLLLDRGANIESRDNLDQSPLSFAAQEGHEALVKLLLERGADMKSQNSSGKTTL